MADASELKTPARKKGAQKRKEREKEKRREEEKKRREKEKKRRRKREEKEERWRLMSWRLREQVVATIVIARALLAHFSCSRH